MMERESASIDPIAVRAVKRGMERIVKERAVETNLALKHFPPHDEMQRIDNKYAQREVNLFHQAGIKHYWPFHLTLLEHSKIEREKTGSKSFFTRTDLILNWTMGNERISGNSGN